MSRKTRGDYRGSVIFDFTVIRYDVGSDRLLTADEADDLGLGGKELAIQLEVSGWVEYCAGQYGKAYEECYPEYYDMEVESILFRNKDWSNLVTDDEYTEICNELDNVVRDG